MASSSISRCLRWLEVPRDEDAWYKTDRWTNRDLIPMPKERRTYKVWTYCIYWCISGMCISAYILGSSLLAYGLNCQEAMGAIAIGSVLVSPLVIACGWMGERHHIGFTVASRFTFGMYGSYFPVLIRLFTTIFWDGLQGSFESKLSPTRADRKAGILRRASYCCHAWCCIPILMAYGSDSCWWHPTDQGFDWYAGVLRLFHLNHGHSSREAAKPFIASSIMFVGTLIGLLAWSVSNNGGGPGPLFWTKSVPIHGSPGWAMMFGIAGILGSWGGGTLGQSDWTRYANRPLTPIIAQTIIAPISIFICGTIGIIVTSCGQGILGETLWEPFQLLPAIQGHYNNSPRARAGVFFAGAGCMGAQLGIDIVLNSVSAGMDLAGLWPRYLNIRRGAYILACAGLAVNPWQYLSNASVFLTVISGFGIFLAPFTGVLLTDYLIVRKCRLVLADLYRGDSSSIYWYTSGFNWRAFASWSAGTAFLMPGYIMSLVNESAYNGWIKLFHLNFVAGVPMTMFIHWIICRIAPPPGLGMGTTIHDDATPFDRLDGVEVDSVEAVREEVKQG